MDTGTVRGMVMTSLLGSGGVDRVAEGDLCTLLLGGLDILGKKYGQNLH